MLRLHVEGKPLWVKAEHVIAFGLGYRDAPNPEFDEDRVPGEANQPTVREEVTMVTIAFVGTIPVDEEVSEVAAIIGVPSEDRE
jgi:hypothetical protein